MIRLLMGLALAVGMGTAATAGPLDPKEVDGGAKWMIHYDFDAFRQTKLGEWVRDKLESEPQLQGLRERAEQRFGIRLGKDLHGVTLYGRNYQQHRGIALVRTEYDRERILSRLERQLNFSVADFRGQPLYTWTPEHVQHVDRRFRQREPRDRSSQATGETLTAFFGPGLIVIGSHPEDVQDALDVLAGDRPALEQNSRLLAESTTGSVFYGAAQDLGELREHADEFHAFPILRQTQCINIATGERGDQMFYQARVEASSEQVAQNLQKVAEGIRAMLELRSATWQALLPIAQGMQVNLDQQTLQIGGTVRAEDVIELLKQIRQKLQPAGMPAGHEPEARRFRTRDI